MTLQLFNFFKIQLTFSAAARIITVSPPYSP